MINKDYVINLYSHSKSCKSDFKGDSGINDLGPKKYDKPTQLFVCRMNIRKKEGVPWSIVHRYFKEYGIGRILHDKDYCSIRKNGLRASFRICSAQEDKPPSKQGWAQ